MKIRPASGLDRERARRLVRAGWLAVGGAAALVAVSTALAGSSVADPSGDANEAPDIASVTMDGASPATISIRVGVANFRQLPPSTQVTALFDVDANRGTGVNGYELAVTYSTESPLLVSRFDGIRMAPVDSSGASATFSAGVLTFTVGRALLGGAASVGVSVVASRTQQVGAARIVASDYAPDTGETAYSPAGEVVVPDPRSDEDAAPDITAIDVSDSPQGAVSFRIATSNYSSLPRGTEVGLVIALAGRAPLEDELFVTYVGSAAQPVVEREERGLAVPVESPAGVEASYDDGSLAVSLGRSELEGAAAIRFGVVTADLVSPGEGEDPGAQGELAAADVAPDGLLDGKRYTYRLANPPPLRLVTDTPTGVPLVPVGGRPFEVSVLVRRSDAFGVVRAGSVACAATFGGIRVRTSGAFVHGRARCALVVPKAGRPATLRGTITIRTAGRAVTTRFSFPVRR